MCNDIGVEQPENHYVAIGMPTEVTLAFDRSSMRVIVNFSSGRKSLLVKGVHKFFVIFIEMICDRLSDHGSHAVTLKKQQI